MFERNANTVGLSNILGFWICHGFWICLGSEYARVHNIMKNVKCWSKLHQFLKWNFFSIGIPFKTKINQTLFKVLVTLKTLLLPRISFLRIICNAITFPKPEYINIFPSVSYPNLFQMGCAIKSPVAHILRIGWKKV